LHGAPAVCMAVNRRARVTIAESAGEFHQVTAPGYADGPSQFLVRDGVFGWRDSSADFELLEHVWRASGIDRTGGLELRLDTSEFLDPTRRCKTGIGSSAALSVALAFALGAVDSNSASPLDVAHRGHLNFQGGLGSGVDIATSAEGGLIEFRTKDRRVNRIEVPAALELRLFWSGVPASTGKKLEKLSSHGPQPSQDALRYSAMRMAEAWRSCNAQLVLDSYREYIQVLQEFSEDHGLGIFDGGHAELVELAEAAGHVYKPCGAGGGDIGILLSDDSQAADAFVEESLPAGFSTLDLRLESRGAYVARKTR
jgi:phosphomevalonate kinase